MVQGIIDFAIQRKTAYPMPVGKVLEIGSYNVNGTIRDAFQAEATEYIGIDIAEGPGVDLVLDATAIAEQWGAGTFDTVLCCECFEHCQKFWKVLEAIRTVIKPGGRLMISTPTFGFPEHKYPKDYYRFGEDAFREVFFEGFECLAVAQVCCQEWPILMGDGIRLSE